MAGAEVTCGDCAIEYEVWPEGGCPNCGSMEPAPEAVVEPEAPPVAEPEAPEPEPEPAPAAAGPPLPVRARPGRRGSRSGRAGGSS